MIYVNLKSKYAVSAMFSLAYYGQFCTVRSLSALINVPAPFLEQIMGSLKKAGLVKSIRGSQGGYQLLKSANEITVLDILLALEGPFKLTDGFSVHDVLKTYWQEVDVGIQRIFNQSLQNLVDEQKIKEHSLMYSI